MPRDISDALKAHLQGEVCTMAVLVKVERTDGNTLAFTTFDEPITFMGTVYDELGSVSVTALKQSVDTGVDTMDIMGILGSMMTGKDIRDRVYQNAVITMYHVNWTDLTQGPLTLGIGTFGEFTLKDATYTGEFRSQTAFMKQQLGWLTSPLCRVARFGNNQCKLNVADYTQVHSITAVTDSSHFTVAADTNVTGWYDYGLLTITSGENVGLQRVCKTSVQSSGMTIVMRDRFPNTIAPGDTISMTAGCLRRFVQDCCGKFNNAVNFHGEPFMPGNLKYMEIGRVP